MGFVRQRVSEQGDSVIERQICIGMITSTDFIRSVRPIVKDASSMRAPFSRSVVKWCLEYFDRYGKAPGKDIGDIFRSQAALMQEDDAKAVEFFLASISGEYAAQDDAFNVPYVLDKAETYFRLQALNGLKEEMSRCLASGRLEDAESLIANYMRPSRPTVKGCDPLRDWPQIMAAFDSSRKEDLTFKLPGDIGSIVGYFERGHLVGIVGATSTGKTWWLWFLAYVAVLRGLNVVFFSLEMSERQMIRRIQQSLHALPIKEYPDPLLIPVFDCAHNQTGECRNADRVNRIRIRQGDQPKPPFAMAPVNYRPCDVCRGTRDYRMEIWWKREDREVITLSDVMSAMVKSPAGPAGRMGRFHLVEYPSGALTPRGLRTYLSNLEYYEGLVADVVVTDYADKMTPDGRYDGYRHGLEEIWQAHKGIAQERKVTVITASQSNTVRTGKRISQGNWDEAIAKLYMVDEGLALNQTPEEKKAGIMLWSVVKQRHDHFDMMEHATVLQQLKIGRPYLDSCRGQMGK